MQPEARFAAIPGSIPLVLVAPHGGRRDPVRHPWSRGRVKVNDLHTPDLARDLATRTGAAALINASLDRNDVDLNRVSEAHDRGGEKWAWPEKDPAWPRDGKPLDWMVLNSAVN